MPPIGRKLTGRACQDGGSESFDLDPWKNQETPADPLIAVGHLPGRTSPLHQRQKATISGFNEVTQVRSYRNTIAEIVVALSELAE